MLALLNNYFFFIFLTTLAISNNLVFFFISWVGLNISLYGILLKSFNSYSKEITLKYFISGSIVTMFLLFSFLIYFLNYLTFEISSANYLYFLNNNSYLFFDHFNVGTLHKIFYSIVISSLLFKLGAFPFHFYLGDLYQALSERETMFIYTISLKLTIFITLIKFMSSFWYLNSLVLNLLLCSGFGSIFVSSFSILKQHKLSKFWAYSYLNSIGFAILAAAAGASSEIGEISFFSAKVYFFSYLFIWFGILDFISRFYLRTCFNASIKKKLYYIGDLIYLNNEEFYFEEGFRLANFKNNIVNTNPRYDFIVLISSLLGLPPAIGFFSKALVYFELSANSSTLLVFWLVVAISPLVAFGYLKLIVYTLISDCEKNTFSETTGDDFVLIEERGNYFLGYRHVTILTVIAPLTYYVNVLYLEYLAHVNF